MIIKIFNKEIFKVLTIFSVSPGSRFRRAEFKEKTFLNNVVLDNTLNDLIKTRIIKKEKKLYFLNFENEYTQSILSVISKQYKYLKEIPLKIYFTLIDFTSEIKQNNEEIFLFGSYSKLIYKENSDIDIAIIGKNPNKEIIKKIITKLEKKYKVIIEVHYFDKEKFYKNKTDPLVKDILRNGIRLI